MVLNYSLASHYLIIYLNRSNEYIYRIVRFAPLYPIHTYTSMGWYIVDVQYYYNGRFYNQEEYKRLQEISHKKIEKNIKKNINKTNKYKKRKFIIRKLFKKYLD